jgi:hypothetical protein
MDESARSSGDRSIRDGAQAWAARTCAIQGLPLKITAPEVIGVVAIQLTAGKAGVDQ